MTAMPLRLSALVLLLAVTAGASRSQVGNPYEAPDWQTAANAVDEQVEATLLQHHAPPLKPCSDAVFIRRVYLDLIGTLPHPAEVERFLVDARPDKRAALVDALFERDEYADYQALKWCDVLRVKSEFPINLWPNAVQAYHHWVRDAIAQNMPYDRFARALLTSSGSNFRVPPVNFYRAVQGRKPADIAGAVALSFMGTRLETWPEAERDKVANIFSRVAFKPTAEWKEEIVQLSPQATEPLEVVFPDGTRAQVPAYQDPRVAFADWLIRADNEWFARAVVNRIWYWLMGHGIIHEPDDIRPDNPPACPGLLRVLEQELVASGYDLRAVYRLILNSRTYQQSSLYSEEPAPQVRFARYTLRLLDAEVLNDALTWLGGPGESYCSQIPEPFTWIPEEQRTIALADGSITSSFLEIFGRPARDTGLMTERNLQPTDAQRLYLLNSAEVGRRLSGSTLLAELTAAAKGNKTDLIRWTYLAVLSRYPTEAEVQTAAGYFARSGLPLNQGALDLAWALINTKEFLYRH